MANVIDFFSKGQKWSTSYSGEGLEAEVSTRGRLRLMIGGQVAELSFVEFVQFLSQLSASLEGETAELYTNTQ